MNYNNLTLTYSCLLANIVGGVYTPSLKTNLGDSPYDQSVTSSIFPISISDISPSSVPSFGGVEITINGTGFPSE